MNVRGEKLVFREESKGRLPFLDFIARHEGMTAVTIEIPRGYRARAVTLKSKGGNISVALPAGSIRAETMNGNVRFDPRGGAFTIHASTRTGRIIVRGREVDDEVYASETGRGNTMEILSMSGAVQIE